MKRDEAYSESSKKNIKADLEQFCFWLEDEKEIPLKNASAYDIKMFLEILKEEGIKIRSIQRKYASISSLISYMGKSEIMNLVNYPLETETHKAKEENRLTEKQISKILKRFEERSIKNDGTRTLECYCYRALVRMLLYCSIKPSDLYNIKMENFYIMNSVGYVTIESEEKGKKKRVEIPSDVLPYIEEYLNERSKVGHQEVYLFQSRLQKKLERRGVLDVISRVGKECKAENLTVNALRVSYWYFLSKKNPMKSNLHLMNEKLDLNLFLEKKEKVRN